MATPFSSVLADTYSGYTWHAIGAPSTADSLRVFSSAGKLLSQFHRDPPASMNIQVWGHLLARISIRPDGQKLRVILWNTPGVDTAQVDSSTLRFGPRNASPRDVRKDDANPTGKLALVMDFSIAESGIAPHSLNACLTGKRSDGAPFEGCDLLPH